MDEDCSLGADECTRARCDLGQVEEPNKCVFLAISDPDCPCTTDADCDDKRTCTADSCDSTGTCINALVDCACTTDADCDDGNSCTSDVCDGDMCRHDPTACCDMNGTCDGGEDCVCADCEDDPMCITTCTPGTPAPTGAPTINSDYTGESVCRGGAFYVDGTNFNTNGTCASWGPNVVSVTPTSGMYMLVDVPTTSAPGMSAVTVDNGTGTATSATQMNFLDQVVPVVSSFSPPSGPTGTTVTAAGTDLDQVTSILLVNGSPLTPTLTNQTATSFEFVLSGPAGVYSLDQVYTMDCGALFPQGVAFTIQ